jgi:hypothetical protein
VIGFPDREISQLSAFSDSIRRCPSPGCGWLAGCRSCATGTCDCRCRRRPPCSSTPRRTSARTSSAGRARLPRDAMTTLAGRARRSRTTKLAACSPSAREPRCREHHNGEVKTSEPSGQAPNEDDARDTRMSVVVRTGGCGSGADSLTVAERSGGGRLLHVRRDRVAPLKFPDGVHHPLPRGAPLGRLEPFHHVLLGCAQLHEKVVVAGACDVHSVSR